VSLVLLFPNFCRAFKLYALKICHDYISLPFAIHITLNIHYCKSPLKQLNLLYYLTSTCTYHAKTVCGITWYHDINFVHLQIVCVSYRWSCNWWDICNIYYVISTWQNGYYFFLLKLMVGIGHCTFWILDYCN
jgi:hypothetical protein